MKNILKKLNEPFPESNSFQDDFRFIVGVGIFVTFFLFFFQPFGVNRYEGNLFWICAIFGIITIIVSTAYEFFCTYILKLEKDIPTWTLGKWILFTIGLVATIATSNYLFLYYMCWVSTDLAAFTQIFIGTLFIGIFPVVLSGLMIQIKADKRNQIQASDMQEVLPITPPTSEAITLTAQSSQPSLTLPIHQLFYLEAMQNYVSIHHRKETTIEKVLFRHTLSAMEKQLQNTSIIRCHRSYLVNTNLIEKVTGNAQGLRLTLKGLPNVQIPVSRKYIPILKALMA